MAKGASPASSPPRSRRVASPRVGLDGRSARSPARPVAENLRPRRRARPPSLTVPPSPGTRAEDATAKAAKAAKAVKRGTKGKLLKKRFSPTFHRYAPIAHRAAPAPLPRRHRPAADAEPANAPT